MQVLSLLPIYLVGKAAANLGGEQRTRKAGEVVGVGVGVAHCARAIGGRWNGENVVKGESWWTRGYKSAASSRVSP